MNSRWDFGADLGGDGRDPLGIIFCLQRLGDKPMLGVSPPQAALRLFNTEVSRCPKISLGSLLRSQKQRGKHMSQKKKKTQTLVSKLSSRIHPAGPMDAFLCLHILHLLPFACFVYAHIPPVLAAFLAFRLSSFL